MVFDILEKSKKEKSLIEFCYYSSDNGFYCGYVIDYGNDFVIIQHYSKLGVSDGILIHKLSDIKSYETETEYLDNIQFLIVNYKTIFEQTFEIEKKNSFNENFIDLFENLIANKDYLVKFEMADEEIYFGFVEWCDDNYFSVLKIDNDGAIIGKATLKFEDLKLYWIDDIDCRKMKMFYDKKYKIM